MAATHWPETQKGLWLGDLLGGMERGLFPEERLDDLSTHGVRHHVHPPTLCRAPPVPAYPMLLTNLALLSRPLVHLFHLSRPCRGARCGRGSRVLLPSSWRMVFWGRAGDLGRPPLCSRGPPAAVSKGGSLLSPSWLVPEVDKGFVNFRG